MSILKYLQESLLDEKRKHSPEEYQELSKALEKYKNRPDSDDIYIHFSENFTDSKNQLINQIGINPNQKYSNPFGVYAYPIDHIADFKINAPYAYILKSKNIPKFSSNISDMSIPEYVRCIKILKSKYFDNPGDAITFEKKTEADSDHNSYGGILFYFILRMSDDKTINPSTRPNIFQTTVWTKDLGYSGVCDLGHGIIHPSEPYQSVWFTPKGYDIVDVIKNIDYTNSLSTAIKKGSADNVQNAIDLIGSDRITMYNLIDATFKGGDVAEVVVNAIDDKLLNDMSTKPDIWKAITYLVKNKSDIKLIVKLMNPTLGQNTSAHESNMRHIIVSAAISDRFDVLDYISSTGYRTTNLGTKDMLDGVGYNSKKLVTPVKKTTNKKKNSFLNNMFGKKDNNKGNIE